MRLASFWEILAGVGLLTGCDPDGFMLGDPAEADADDDAPPKERPRDYPDADEGTCSAWKFAYCDAFSACSAFETREDCELDLGWLVCKEEAPLGTCQARIEQALEDEDCDDLPSDCTPDEIADRSLVIELCEDIHLALCEHRLFCGLELSLDGCVQTLGLVEPCEGFTSFLPSAVDCAEAYGVLGCGEPMPKVCAGSLRR